MTEDTKTTPDQTEPSPEVKAMNDHLDALLGMDVRKPGSAAKLPAVIRITETLEATGGKEFPVFPPSYAGDNKNEPRYDLNGIEWGEVLREKSAKDGTKRITRYIKHARHCTMDSPQSHANRTEIAFRDDDALRSLVPQAEAKIPRKAEFADQSNTNLLALPHRVADFRVRASDQKQAAANAIKAFANGDALPLLRFMPTSIIFGFWDSRAEGYQHKHPRILLSRIDAFGIVPCEKRSLYTGPYSKDECASVVLGNDNLAQQLSDYDVKADDDDEQAKAGKEAKKWADKMAERGFSNALGSGLGGVFADRIERLALISLTDIASVFCCKPTEGEGTERQNTAKKPEPDKDLTDAARRYLLALALLAEGHPRSIGSYRLRSGCELLPSGKKTELVGAGNDTENANALKSLCDNRDLLIAVAEDARRRILKIPASLSEFVCTPASLKSDLNPKAEKSPAELAEAAQAEANKAAAEATSAEEKANQSGQKKDRTAAEKKRKKANELAAKAEELEKLAAPAADSAQASQMPTQA
jgi:CRISPR-associated protein Csb1